MYFRSDFSGCLISLILFLLLLSLLKELWWLIVGIAVVLIVAYWCRKIYLLLLNNKNEQYNKYNPEMGEVFKICPYCNSKVRVTEITCPVCKRALN